MKKTSLFLFLCGIYSLYIYYTSTSETELLVIGLMDVLFALFLFLEQIGKDLYLIDNNKQNQSWL
mgnify:FL=1